VSTVLIACGGTGGHLAPGIAVAEELRERGCMPVLLISRKQVDSALIRKYASLDFHKAPGRAYAGDLISRCRALLDVVYGILFSCKLIRRYRPSSVLLFGGFLSLGLGLAARLLRVPVALHEANSQPGRAVRMLQPLASRIYLPEGVRLSGSPDSVRYCGYPVRRDIRPLPKDVARANLGLKTTGTLLVIIGGSQGAESLNQWARENFPSLAEAGVSVYCVAGFGKVSEENLVYDLSDGQTCTARFVAFTDQMGDVLSAADLVISRAGAGAIAEMIRCRAPSVLIPYPYAADNHQMANAEAHENEGAGVVLGQDRIDALLGTVQTLLGDSARLASMRVQCERLNAIDAARSTAEDLLALATGEPAEDISS
jgi:UDP-N-acetylglucosamine--N-acetylmuramyl-(pentapeptide) pyrophosphoryl-undecaprenol N-acetylglucosamine transferase|tara:strand:+ start:1640 stop:2749 length:1110 start_codon:yes stop_codon:yes gene_type:complete